MFVQFLNTLERDHPNRSFVCWAYAYAHIHTDVGYDYDNCH